MAFPVRQTKSRAGRGGGQVNREPHTYRLNQGHHCFCHFILQSMIAEPPNLRVQQNQNMALDAQSNWNIEMLQTSCKISDSEIDSSATASTPVTNSSGREIHLPVEIILNIVSFFPTTLSNQPTLWACALVSQTWYDGTIARLYKRPHLSSSNFREFVRTVCPSKNAHIKKSELADMVECLDMSLLSYDGSKSRFS